MVYLILSQYIFAFFNTKQNLKKKKKKKDENISFDLILISR